MAVLLISLFVYLLLCVATTIAMKILPSEFFGEIPDIVGSDCKHRWLATIFVGIVLTIVYLLMFIAMPVLFLIFYKKRKEQFEIEKLREIEHIRQKKEAEEEKKRMKIVMSRGCNIKKIHDDKFQPVYSQIIYVESEYDENLNDFFRRNNKEICRVFREEYNRKYALGSSRDYLVLPLSYRNDRGYDFVYLPEFYNSDTIAETVGYIDPSSERQQKISGSEIAKRFYEWFLSEYNITKKGESCPNEIKHGLVRLIHTDTNWELGVVEDTYSFLPLEYTNDEDMFVRIREYLEFVGNGGEILYCAKTVEHNKDFADEEFPIEAQKLAEEIRDRVAKLRNMGINTFLINQLLIEPPKPSRLLITEDFKIILTDYNNKEIKMAFLPKVVFFFFLRHPEGICFKQLCDYKDELFAIYRCISNRENEEKMFDSINSITDSTNNSINEKCSRIREAFLREFDNENASHYFISYIDKSLYKKTISLDRSLVTDLSGVTAKIDDK